MDDKAQKDTATDILKQAQASTGNVKDLDLPLPDGVDRDNLRTLLLMYERKNPGVLAFLKKEARREQHEAGSLKRNASFKKRDLGIVNTEANGRVVFELPADLYGQIERAFPLMFRDPKHFAWFKRNFAELAVPEEL